MYGAGLTEVENAQQELRAVQRILQMLSRLAVICTEGRAALKAQTQLSGEGGGRLVIFVGGGLTGPRAAGRCSLSPE